MAKYIEQESFIRWVREFRPGDSELVSAIINAPAADVAPVRHGRCPVCSGQEVLAQDCDNGYSVEIDAESQEMTLWNGDTCLAAISVDYCQVCGSRMDGAE